MTELRLRSRLARLSRHDLALLLRAFGVLLWVRLNLFLHRTPYLRGKIAQLAARAPLDPAPAAADLREVVWSVRNAARFVPVGSCLTQALAGQYLLAARGAESTVRLSMPVAGTHQAPAFRPHAWLMSGRMILLGGTPDELARHRALVEFHPDRPDAGVPVSSIGAPFGTEAPPP